MMAEDQLSHDSIENTPVFEDHFGLVKSIVHSFDRSCRPEDSEIFSVACLGLMKAISTFAPGKSKFSYWATKIIRNHILSEKRKSRELAIPMSVADSEEVNRSLAKTDRNFPSELVLSMMEPSPSDTKSESENKRILRRHYLDEVSMAEIAREVGFTRETIRQRTNKAIDSIRKKYAAILDNHPFCIAGSPSSEA
jgi:RNA polymerase sigma factor (sigma-70 family)